MNPIILAIGLLLGIGIAVIPMYYVDKKYSHRTLSPLHITATAIALLMACIAAYVHHDFVSFMAVGSVIVCIGWFAVIGILAWGIKHNTD